MGTSARRASARSFWLHIGALALAAAVGSAGAAPAHAAPAGSPAQTPAPGTGDGPAAISLATQGTASPYTVAAAAETGPYVTLQGRGFGHGRGMSQWGARGMAAQGRTTAEILSFYYPGTALTDDLGNPDVRVRLGSKTQTDPTPIVAETGLTVTDGTCTETLPTDNASQWRAEPTETGWKLGVLTKQPFILWSTYPTTCDSFAAAERLTFSATDGTLTIYLAGATSARQYRGALRVVRDTDPNTLGSAWHDVVNVLPMDSYLWSVVPAEMPASWNRAAVAAQAVAARSYAARRLGSSAAWDLCDSIACQYYPGMSSTTTPEHADSTAAVNETSGMVVRYNGAVALTEFGSTNGGHTAQGSAPYQPQQVDPYDGYFAEAPDTWSYDLPVSLIEANWGIGTFRELKIARDGFGHYYHGRVSSMSLVGSEGAVWTEGSTFMARLGLRSTYFMPVGSQVGGDYAVNGFSDLLARDSAGNLWLYPGSGRGTHLERTQISTGWVGATEVLSPGDVDGDGNPDLLARDSAGTMWRYRGDGRGGIESSTPVSNGWQTYSQLVTPGDLDRDGFADVMARDSSGVMWLYPGNGKGGHLARKKIGSGWGSLSEIEAVGDFDGNGTADLVARVPAGTLYLYSFSSTGTYTGAKALSNGWGSYSALTGAGDFSGDGHPDLLARDGAGVLWVYPGNGSGGWLPRTRVGGGWGPYTMAS